MARTTRKALLALTLAFAPQRFAAADSNGSYYFKDTSQKGLDGIGATGVLPQVTADPSRQRPDPTLMKNEYMRGPMDAPGVYMGTESTKRFPPETDIGLAWGRVKNDQGNLLWTDDPSGTDMGNAGHAFVIHVNASAANPNVYTFAATSADGKNYDVLGADGQPLKVTVQPVANEDSQELALNQLAHDKVKLAGKDGALGGDGGMTLLPDMAFKPFARVADGSENHGYRSYSGKNPGFHLYPGEPFEMVVSTEGKDSLRLRIKDLKTGKTFDWTFPAKGVSPGQRDLVWKRVDSIDEPDTPAKGSGLRAIPTRTTALGMDWTRTFLIPSRTKFDEKKTDVAKLPSFEAEGHDQYPPSPSTVFEFARNDEGGIKIGIDPTRWAHHPAKAPAAPQGPPQRALGVFDQWTLALAKKTFLDLYQQPLGAETSADAFMRFVMQFPPSIQEGAAAPKGAIIFYLDHLGVSNGDGTVETSKDHHEPFGEPLGWVTPK